MNYFRWILLFLEHLPLLTLTNYPAKSWTFQNFIMEKLNTVIIQIKWIDFYISFFELGNIEDNNYFAL